MVNLNSSLFIVDSIDSTTKYLKPRCKCTFTMKLCVFNLNINKCQPTTITCFQMIAGYFEYINKSRIATSVWG